MNDFEKQVLSDLAELKTQMKALVGNGNPGRIRQLEEQVEQHERLAQRVGGIGAALATLITLAHFAIDWLRPRF